MSATLQPGVIKFPRREPVQLDPDLKAFLDEVIIPGLVREAVEELREENLLEVRSQSMEDCARNPIVEVTR